MTENKIYDLLVVGGGASGLSAAVSAYIRGKSVAILEKEDKLGKKILVSGNGRCNLSSTCVSAEKYNTSAVGEIIKADVRGFFASIGLATKASDDRVYPYSESALSVVNALRRSFGGDVFVGETVTKITRENGMFLCNGRTARSVLIATGSDATKGTDSTGLLAAFGHTVTPFRPAVVPLLTDTEYIKGLSGIRAKCNLVLLSNGKSVRTEKGEILFRENGISGIAAMTVSSEIARKEGKYDLAIDFVPDVNSEEIHALTKKFGAEAFLQKAVAQCVEKQARARKIAVSECLRDFRVTNVRCADMTKAQVANGGIELSEFDENLQSKLQKGLYAGGEVLNVDGECGGYNLHFAFACGIKVGSVC